MTTDEIKEYIDNAIETAFAQNIVIDTAQILKKALIDTKGMLDQLDNEWVDVRDRLPDVDTNSPYKHKYLVTEINGNVREACFSKYKDGTHRWYIFGISSVGGVGGTGSTPHTYGNVTLENVIGWREKPKPYKREEQKYGIRYVDDKKK